MARPNSLASTILISALAASAAHDASAGPLNPPGGPIGETNQVFESLTGFIPINQDTAPGTADSVFCISTPGRYYLPDDIVVPAGKHGIKVTTDDFVIDHNGAEIIGLPGSLDGVYVAPVAGPTEFQGVTLGAEISDMGGNGITLVSPPGGGSYSYVFAGSNVSGVTGDGINAGASGGAPGEHTVDIWGGLFESIGGDGIDVDLDGAGHSRCACAGLTINGVGGDGVVIDSVALSQKLEVLFGDLDICGTAGNGVAGTLQGSEVDFGFGSFFSPETFGLTDGDLLAFILAEAGPQLLADPSFLREIGLDGINLFVEADRLLRGEVSNTVLRGIAGAAYLLDFTPTSSAAELNQLFDGVSFFGTGTGVSLAKSGAAQLGSIALTVKECDFQKPGLNGVKIDNGIKGAQKLSFDFEKVKVSGAANEGIDIESFNTNQATTLRDVTVQDCGGFGAEIGNNATIDGCTFNNNSTGLTLGNDCLVTNTQCNRNRSSGIDGQIGNQIVNCVVSFNDQNGLVLLNSSLVSGVAAKSNGAMFGSGMIIGGNSLIEDCTVASSATDGIFCESFCQIRNCIVTNSQNENIECGTNCTIEGCTIHFGQNGVYMLGDSGRITGCTFGLHFQNGVFLMGSGCTLRDNTIAGGHVNATGIAVSGNSNRVTQNDVSRYGTGVSIMGEKNLVVRNFVSNNFTSDLVVVPTGMLATENLVGEIFDAVSAARSELNETDSAWSNFE